MIDTNPPAADEFTQVSYDTTASSVIREQPMENEEALCAWHPDLYESVDFDPYRSTGKWRVMMSPAVEENFGHFDAKERIKQAEFLREIARQLEMSANVALADQKPRKLNPMRQLEMSEVSSN